ncbi:substrate-binding domain-containing protein [Pantoea sp. NSTU24]|uniref:substrate-binding domain-containing protein n=1 Tax=Pantoea sp. NSTU24 TaxID=3391144 RepID=UPI003D06D74B
MLRVAAAGSLKPVWPALMACFPMPVETRFGPAGLLREEIEAGMPCDLFVSASEAHVQPLRQAGQALATQTFATNTLCLTVRSDRLQAGDDWFTLLTRDRLRIATSTPVDDPAGDYAQQLFSRMGKAGEAVRQRARARVGGRHSPPIPPGRLAAEWLILEDRSDLFIGYASYRVALSRIAGLTVMAIPPEFNPVAHYCYAIIAPEAQQLADFLVSERAQMHFCKAGFGRVFGT